MDPRRRRFAAGLLAATATALAPAVSRAAGEVTAVATLETDRVQVGEGVRLSLTIRSSGGVRLGPPTLSSIEGNFEIASQSSVSGGVSFSFGMGGRAPVSERTTHLVLIPLKPGEFDLGFTVEADGEVVKSNVPKLTVTEAEAPPPPDASQGALPSEPRGDIFLWAMTDKTVAYVGEQVTYALDVYERRQFLNVHLRKPPSFSDFFSHELAQGEAQTISVGGVPYRVEPGIRRALFPQRAGPLQIGAGEVSVGLRKRLHSPELKVDVLPLPGEGQPKGFSPNNVGRYTIETSVDRTKVDPGEPFTLTVKIGGTGNIEVLDPGNWPEIAGARRYEPKVETAVRTGPVIGGTRQYEFLVIPENGGPITIPPHTLAFFDPDDESYQVATSTEIVVEVVGATAAPVAEAPAVDEPAEDEARLAELIEGDSLTDRAAPTRWLSTERWVYGMLAVPTLAAAGLGGAAMLRRFGPDERARTRANEKMRRQVRIKAAEDAVESGEGFHGTLSKMLHELAVRRAGTDGVGLPRPELLRLLQERDVVADDLDALRGLLDECDEARFAAQTGSADDRRSLLDRAMALVHGSSLSKEGLS